MGYSLGLTNTSGFADGTEMKGSPAGREQGPPVARAAGIKLAHSSALPPQGRHFGSFYSTVSYCPVSGGYQKIQPFNRPDTKEDTETKSYMDTGQSWDQV